jgi:hypothetical protein
MINCPWVFQPVWMIIKGLLAPRTVSKITILSVGYDKELLHEIPRASLPSKIFSPFILINSFNCII